jgi:hypothetical protein
LPVKPCSRVEVPQLPPRPSSPWARGHFSEPGMKKLTTSFFSFLKSALPPYFCCQGGSLLFLSKLWKDCFLLTAQAVVSHQSKV